MKYGKTGRPRILVVDDEPLIALTSSAILKHAGYEVGTAFNGEEAVENAAAFRPDLLLTDISMGQMNGVDAAVQITASLPMCKVLFVSGHSSMNELLESTPENLVYSHMPKPVPVPDLLAAIAYLLPQETELADHPVIEVERDRMELQNLAQTAIARLNACKAMHDAFSTAGLGQTPAPTRAEVQAEMVGQCTALSGSTERWTHTRKPPARDNQTMVQLQAASLA